MITTIGNLSLCAAVLAAAGAILASVAAVRFGPPPSRREAASPRPPLNVAAGWLSAARWLIVGTALAFTIASIALLIALATGDFRFTYVAAYTDRALPLGYKLAAFWAGQEGSLLLWAWLLGVLCVIGVWGYRKLSNPEFAIAHGVMGAVCAVFAAFLLFAANPFQVFEGPAPFDGRGLNPMLQDVAMLAHPPLLFLGYAAYTIPFAVLVGVLIAGRSDNRWLRSIRRWSLAAWALLGAGIIVGGWWAYIELGWGGYWAWDPVENASLLPWLTGTALLHSIMVQQRRGMYKFWNASLIALTFILCIFGTYLTRSGIVDSVHTFAGSPLASAFLIFIVVTGLFSVGLIVWRRGLLRPEHELESLFSREGAFLAANVLLVAMMLITLVGTIFPVLTGPFLSEPLSAKEPFYNRTVAPMILVLAAIMATGPVLAYGPTAPARIARDLTLPGLGAALTVVIVLAAGVHNLWAVAVAGVASLGTLAVVIGLARSVAARRRSTGEPLALAAVRLIDKDHRRYGGQVVHLGVMLMVIGVAGSSLYNTDEIHRLKPGESVAVGRHTLTYHGLMELPRGNHTAIQADLRIRDERGNTRTLTPERRFYKNWEDKPQSQVAISTDWRQDLYISLAGWEDAGRLTALQVKINPLVVWIWIGSIIMGVGAVVCLVPRLLPEARRHATTDDACRGAVVPAAHAALADRSAEPQDGPATSSPHAPALGGSHDTSATETPTEVRA